MIFSLFGCGSHSTDDRLAHRPGESVISPSGQYIATLIQGIQRPEDGGVDVYHVVISDADGNEVYRGDRRLAANFGLAVTWLPTADHQLWILSSDIGVSHVDRGPGGIWTRTPAGREDVPEEIKTSVRGRSSASRNDRSSRSSDDRLATQPGESVISPSGQYIATFIHGIQRPTDGGVDVYYVVISDADGHEVFRGEERHAANFGRAITWLSTADEQLWILSKDTGTSHVDRGPEGTWTETGITPETKDTIPEEIEAWG